MNFLKKHFLDLVLVILIGLLIWSIIQARQINNLIKDAEAISEEVSVLNEDTVDLISAVESEPITTFLGEYTITAYCACEKCCGKWAKDRKDNIVCGASGAELESGYSAASNSFDFGTVLEIEGLGTVEVQDRTSKHINDRYDGKIIDIYFSTHGEALAFGKQTRNVYIFT